MVNQLLAQAIQELQNLNQGEEFLVRDLFKGYEWNRIPLDVRLLLGRLFLNSVNSTLAGKVALSRKTSAQQQKYVLL